jgi:integrase
LDTHVAQRIFEIVWKLKKLGRKETTLKPIARRLRYLASHVDIDDPEKVKEYILAKECSEGHKDNLVDAYSHYVNHCGLVWQKPSYMRYEKIRKIPREEDINRIIAVATLKYATAYSVLRDTGLRPIELGWLKVQDFDLETGYFYPTTAKYGASRVLKVKASTLAMLKKYISRYGFGQNDLLWNSKRVRENWSRNKKVVAERLQESRLLSIRLYDLRHFKGSMEYKKTKDIVYVMRLLGHKNIKNTLRYVHEVDLGEDQYTCKVSRTVEEASQLIELGFEYVTEIDGTKLFRKRK